MRAILVAGLVVGFSLGISSTSALARQQAINGQVVHTRAAPVVLHRAVPPFKGVHVYENPGRGEGRRGR